jgi:hypothetical protein
VSTEEFRKKSIAPINGVFLPKLETGYEQACGSKKSVDCPEEYPAVQPSLLLGTFCDDRGLAVRLYL